MRSRGVHFVGSFPAESTEVAMRVMLDGAGPLLRTLPTGESRRYEYYVRPILEDLVAQGALEVSKPGQWMMRNCRNWCAWAKFRTTRWCGMKGWQTGNRITGSHL